MRTRSPPTLLPAQIRRFDRREAPPPSGSGQEWTEYQVASGSMVLSRHRSAHEASAFLEGWRAASLGNGGTVAPNAGRASLHPDKWHAGYRAYMQEHT